MARNQPSTGDVDTSVLRREMPFPLFERALAGATNDEALEMGYRLLEALADRADRAADLAVDMPANRDIVNEAHAFTRSVDALMPSWFAVHLDRVERAHHKAVDARKDVEVTIAGREAGVSPLDYSRGRVRKMVREMEDSGKAWMAQHERNRAEGKKLVTELGDLTSERVIEATHAAVAKCRGNNVRVSDVAAELLPAVADIKTPGRFAVINRVTVVMRALAKDGRLVQIEPDRADDPWKRRRCRWNVVDG